jgi:hypothetical protein
MLTAMAENALETMKQEAGPEDPIIRKRPLIKRNKNGEEMIYYRWYGSWHDGNKTVMKYLGSCRKMSEEEALEKARKLKADAL